MSVFYSKSLCLIFLGHFAVLTPTFFLFLRHFLDFTDVGPEWFLAKSRCACCRLKPACWWKKILTLSSVKYGRFYWIFLGKSLWSESIFTGHGPLLKSMTALLISHVACHYIIIWTQCHISNDKIDKNLH